MAWDDFYLTTSGDNMNSGTTTANTATVTQTNGNWNATTGVFAAASGLPFAAVSVGDWASIYPDGTTSGAVFIAKVTAVGGSGASITVSLTNKFGTAPTTSATVRSCKIGGAWGSFEQLFSTSLTTTIATGLSVRVNVKAGTWTDATAGGGRTFQLSAGSAGASRFWLRGYRTSPGDLDSDSRSVLVPGTDIPQLTFTGNAFLNVSPWVVWSYFSVKCTTAVSFVLQYNSTGNAPMLYRCQFENTSSSNAACRAASIGGIICIRCVFKATSIASSAVGLISSGGIIQDCYVGGGVIALLCGGTHHVHGCVIKDFTTSGISITTNNPVIRLGNNTIVGSSATNGIIASGTFSTAMLVVYKNIISGCTNAIQVPANGGTGIMCYLNSIYNCTNSFVNFGDSPTFLTRIESSTPFTSSTDVTPNTGGAGGNNLQALETKSYCTSMYVGAINRDRLIGYRR